MDERSTAAAAQHQAPTLDSLALDAMDRETDAVEFGRMLEKARRSMRWTYRDVAEKAGLPSHMGIWQSCTNGADMLATTRARIVRAFRRATHRRR